MLVLCAVCAVLPLYWLLSVFISLFGVATNFSRCFSSERNFLFCAKRHFNMLPLHLNAGAYGVCVFRSWFNSVFLSFFCAFLPWTIFIESVLYGQEMPNIQHSICSMCDGCWHPSSMEILARHMDQCCNLCSNALFASLVFRSLVPNSIQFNQIVLPQSVRTAFYLRLLAHKHTHTHTLFNLILTLALHPAETIHLRNTCSTYFWFGE